MRFLKKVIIAVLSALVFSVSLTFFSFNNYFIIYLIYSLPIYLTVGILYSYLIDVFFDKIQFHNELLKYIIYFFVYIVGGFLIVGLLLLIILLVDGSLANLLISRFFITGAFASLLFFHISLASNKMLKIHSKIK